MSNQSRILVVEDSKFFRTLVCREIARRIDAEVVTAQSLAEAKVKVEAAARPFDLALADLILPDAQEGEVVDWLQGHGVPCIVFTGIFSDELRERLLAQHIIDYVVKDTPSSLNYLMGLVEELSRNRQNKVLVVDDSATARHHIAGLLQSYQFQVVEAEDGEQGLAVLAADPDIRLVVTDYHMPVMDGVEMVKRMRATHDQDRLAIIGVSSGGGSALSARFIKFGANDFINKPFLPEEFLWRVMQNVRMLDMVKRLTELTVIDPLTGLHNRRFLFDAGRTLIARAARDGVPVTVAMIDVDHFKAVNDTYGHDGGDAVLRRIGAVLRSMSRASDVVARFGGEEFAILATDMDEAGARTYFERLRAAIAAEPVPHDGQALAVTASFGICHAAQGALDGMLKTADEMLYRAKANGRDRIEGV